jgi:arylsulfatase A-like enzyme
MPTSETEPRVRNGTAAHLSTDDLVRGAAVLAIVMAWVEIGVRLARLYFSRNPFDAGASIVWMAPLMNLVWFGGAALIGIVGRRVLPRVMTSVAVIALLMMPAYLTAAWLIPGMHQEAAIVLALGLAVQSGRVLARRTTGFARLARRAVVPLVAAAALAAVVIEGWQRVQESRALAALPEPAPGAPNVLFLILDTVRSYSVSGYGYPRPTTPTLDSLARAGVRFDRAFVPASWTMPSHASIFTGRWPYELRTGPRSPLGSEHPTLAEAMADAGWVTGGFAANHAYLTWEHGLTRGFTRWEGYPAGLAMFFSASEIGRTLMEYNTFRKPLGFYDSPKRKTARMVNEQFLDWVGEIDGRPFYAFLNYFDAHHPYLPPEPYLTRFGPHGVIRWRGGELEFDELDSAEIVRKHNQYDGGIAYVDAEIGRMLNALRERGRLDNTIVIVASDHGEHWGEHERLSHGNSMYRELLQVPLIVVGPGVPGRGERIPAVVSLRDLPATILDVAGVPNESAVPGASLLPLTRGDSSAARSPAFSEDASFGTRGARSLVGNGYHYIRLHDGREQLFDLERDSLAHTNLAEDPAHAAILATLRSRMDSITGGAPPPDIESR